MSALSRSAEVGRLPPSTGSARSGCGVTGRIAIDDIAPAISGGWPTKAVVGEVIPVRAVVWREGHDALGATLVTLAPNGSQQRIHMVPALEPDVFNATFSPTVEGDWRFRIEAWG